MPVRRASEDNCLLKVFAENAFVACKSWNRPYITTPLSLINVRLGVSESFVSPRTFTK